MSWRKKTICWILSGAAAVLLTALIYYWPGEADDVTESKDLAGAGDARTPIEATSANLTATLSEGTVPVSSGPSWEQIDDPAQDGWHSEVFSSRAAKQLELLGKNLEGIVPTNSDLLKALVTDDISCTPLVPDHLETIYDDGVVTALRGRAGEQEIEISGREPFQKAFEKMADPFRQAQDVHAKFKIYRVKNMSASIVTEQIVSISGRTESGMLQQNAVWRIDWQTTDNASGPKMREVNVMRFEQVATRNAEGKLFEDCTEAILGRNDCYSEQLLYGYNHWLRRMQGLRYQQILGTPGIAVGDVNGDGLDDLFLCQERGLPNRLFLHNADGTAIEASATWGVDWLEDSRSAILVDFDNDGDQDLAVAILGGVALAENEGGRSFRFHTVLATTDDTMSLAIADYDHDGRPDLYVCVYHPYGLSSDLNEIDATAPDFVYHDANNAGANHLFRNEFDKQKGWSFRDVTREVGLDTNNRRWSYAATWEDYDNDGDQDLYVANDFGRDNLYQNDGGQFVDVAAQAGVEDAGSGMAVTWGDYTRDGWMDAYISNMFSSAGNRITFQHEFKANAPGEVKRRLQRFARGNTLLENQGDGRFRDRSASAGVEMGRWAWSSIFADLNNDGWEDLVVANGYITGSGSGDL